MNISQLITKSRSPAHIFNLGKIRYYSINSEEKIVLPKRIPRGPTDILRALESTVGRDFTAAHYKYHDDPFLIPMSNIGKRTFAMAQEAGRKAAQFIRREHFELFQHKEAEPTIEAFLPPVFYNENSKVTENDLLNAINHSHISDAKFIYNLLKSKNIEISSKTMQSLLEVVCFHNSEDPLADDLMEERWFRQSTKPKEKQRKMWKDGDFAEELFISIDNPSSEAYCAIIQGMAKYYQAERAWQLFEEAQTKNISLNTAAFNAIISIVNFIKDHYDMRWNLIINLLTQMEQNNLKPNLDTLNATLLAVAHTGSNKVAKENMLKILAEFKALGIEPTLASWYHVLIVYYKDNGPPSSILYEIVNYLENKELEIKHLKDVNFFISAMDICRNVLGDVELARRIHNILCNGNNYNLVGDSFKESIYFRNYFCLLCANQSFDEFMKDTYQVFVPHIYVPEFGVMSEVLNQVEIHGAVEYIPRIWSDMIIFDQVHRETLLDGVLNIMVNNPQPADSDLNEKFSNVAWDIYTRGQAESEYNKLQLTGDRLGKILLILTRQKNFEKASNVMDKLDKDHQNIVGVPKLDALSSFLDICIEEKAPTKAINCIQYCYDCGFPDVTDMARKVKTKLTLDENYMKRLKNIVGDL